MNHAEKGPNGYINKHPHGIHLGVYKGIASDLMELNEPVADGFMRVSDMRSDVVVIQKQQDRVRDYDEVGFVRVAKILKLPKLEFWKNGNGLVQTKKDNDVWYIAVNDQDLADRVARIDNDKRKFDDRFVDAFRAEVNNGLTACLRREKLLNGGHYNFGLLVGYHGLLGYDLLLGPAILAAALASGDAEMAAKAVGITATANAVWNGFNLFGAGMTYVEERLLEFLLGPNYLMKRHTPHFSDPFVKHSVFELVMPSVPVDRIVRGLYYLNQHGQEMIKTGQR